MEFVRSKAGLDVVANRVGLVTHKGAIVARLSVIHQRQKSRHNSGFQNGCWEATVMLYLCNRWRHKTVKIKLWVHPTKAPSNTKLQLLFKKKTMNGNCIINGDRIQRVVALLVTVCRSVL
jgi:hypothetical protein